MELVIIWTRLNVLDVHVVDNGDVKTNRNGTRLPPWLLMIGSCWMIIIEDNITDGFGGPDQWWPDLKATWPHTSLFIILMAAGFSVDTQIKYKNCPLIYIPSHLLHGAHNHNSCLDGLRHRSHGYGCRGNRHGHWLDLLLVPKLTGLGEGLWGNGRGGGRLVGQGELEQRQRDRLFFHSGHLPSVLLLPSGPVLHPDARVHRLVPPQVIAVLELLVAGGADVGGSAWLREQFDWQTQQINSVFFFTLNEYQE